MVIYQEPPFEKMFVLSVLLPSLMAWSRVDESLITTSKVGNLILAAWRVGDIFIEVTAALVKL